MLISIIIFMLAKEALHVILEVLVLEICDTLPALGPFMSSELLLWACSWCYRLGEAPKTLRIKRLLLLTSEVIDNTIEFGPHLPRVLLIFLVLFILFLNLPTV